MKCKRFSDGRSHSHKKLQAMRQQAVKAVREGQAVTQVAAAYGLNVRTIYRWVAHFANGGPNALIAKAIPGRPSKISEGEMTWLAQNIRGHSPQQFKFEYGLWTLSLIKAVIERQFGKSLALSSVSRIMKLLGFTARKPVCQAWRQDAVLVHTWEQRTFPAIRRKAKAARAAVFFVDEAELPQDYHAGTNCGQEDETPSVRSPPHCLPFNIISAVSPRGDFRFMPHEDTVSSDIFVAFLNRLLIGAERPIFLIVDAHSIPVKKSATVKRFVTDQRGKLKLFFWPP